MPERPRLELQLDKDVVALYQCSAEVRDGKEVSHQKSAEQVLSNIDLSVGEKDTWILKLIYHLEHLSPFSLFKESYSPNRKVALTGGKCWCCKNLSKNFLVKIPICVFPLS